MWCPATGYTSLLCRPWLVTSSRKAHRVLVTDKCNNKLDQHCLKQCFLSTTRPFGKKTVKQCHSYGLISHGNPLRVDDKINTHKHPNTNTQRNYKAHTLHVHIVNCGLLRFSWLYDIFIEKTVLTQIPWIHNISYKSMMYVRARRERIFVDNLRTFFRMKLTKSSGVYWSSIINEPELMTGWE